MSNKKKVVYTMSNIFDHNNKDMPLDRYPYMDNNLKKYTGDISDLEKRVSKIESDIYSEAVIIEFDNENIADLIDIDDQFSRIGEIRNAIICIYGKFTMIRIFFKFNDYEGWINEKGFENPENYNYKQYNFTLGRLKDYIPAIFTSGGSSRFASQINTSGLINVRFITPFYNYNSDNGQILAFTYLRN